MPRPAKPAKRRAVPAPAAPSHKNKPIVQYDHQAAKDIDETNFPGVTLVKYPTQLHH